MTERPLWHCPKCGARLISRNLWHSCGRFTLEALFAGSAPGILAVARKYVALLESLGDVQVLPQKTRLVAVARVRFAGLYPRKGHFIAGFALHRWLTNRRIVKTVDYGPRWRGHYVRITSAPDLNDELRAWLQESHDVVGLQSDLAEQRVGRAKSRRATIEAARIRTSIRRDKPTIGGRPESNPENAVISDRGTQIGEQPK